MDTAYGGAVSCTCLSQVGQHQRYQVGCLLWIKLLRSGLPASKQWNCHFQVCDKVPKQECTNVPRQECKKVPRQVPTFTYIEISAVKDII